MNVGATGRLIATVGTTTATNRNVIWSSSDNSICYVDANGNLSAESVGNAVITATAADGSGVTASCIVRVVNPVTRIEIVPSTVRLLVGDSQKVTANVYPENATIKDVAWTSSNESIATVDEDGEIFALSTGKVKITATSQDGNNIKGICWVYVTPVVNITSLKINSKDIYIFCRQRIKNYNEEKHVITEQTVVKFYNATLSNEDHFMKKYNAYGSASWSDVKKALILCILDFRRNEFMWEGLRWWDMMRYRIPITHTTKEGDSNTLYPGDDRWLLQLPETAELADVQLNPRSNFLSRQW